MICDGCNNEIGGFVNEEMVCPFCEKDVSHLFKNYVEDGKSLQPGSTENTNTNLTSEKAYIKKSTPVSTIFFMILQVLFIIPIVNLIFLFILSFKEDANENVKAFARSFLSWYAIACTALIAFIAVLIVKRYPLDLFYWFTQFKALINSIPDF